MKYKETISKIVKILKTEYRAEKIILFGSCVSGKITRDSDIDMLIIKDTDASYGERWLEVGRLVRNIKKNIPFEPFIITHEELKKGLSRNLFLQEIVKKGKVLYEKN